MSRGADRRQFYVLDLLRGIAALAVAGFHLNHQLREIFPSSHLAVDLFFALSGFVITHSYQQRLVANLGVREFILIRIMRLYPLYILGTAVGMLMAGIGLAMGAKGEWTDFIVSILFAMLFLPVARQFSYNGSHIYPFNFPAWSLAWEIAINAFYAVIVKWLNNLLLSIILVSGAILLAYAAWNFGTLDGGSKFDEMALGPMRVVYSFFAGVGIYRIWERGALPLLRLPYWLVSALLLSIFAFRPDNGALYDFIMALVAFPLIVLAGTKDPSVKMCRLCSTMGIMSYPLYALHGPFSKIGKGVLNKIEYPEIVTLCVELAFLGSFVVIAFAAHRYVDKPARAWLSSLLSDRQRLRQMHPA